MLEAPIIGAAVLGFLAIYMFFKLGKNTGKEHIALQLLLLSIFIGSIVVLGGAVYKSSNCDLLINSSTINGTTTNYEYSYICQDEPVGISDTFLKLTQWFYRLMTLYLILYFIYKVLLALNYDLVQKLRHRFK